MHVTGEGSSLAVSCVEPVIDTLDGSTLDGSCPSMGPKYGYFMVLLPWPGHHLSTAILACSQSQFVLYAL